MWNVPKQVLISGLLVNAGEEGSGALDEGGGGAGLLAGAVEVGGDLGDEAFGA